MATTTHETVLEAMAAGREAGVTDRTMRFADPPRPEGAKPSWYELYGEAWHNHPGNPRHWPVMVPWSFATHGKPKRGPSKVVLALQARVRELEAALAEARAS